MPTIFTDRLILRPQTIADFAAWYPLYADPVLMNGSGFTPEEGWNRLLRNIGHWTVFGYSIFTIRQKSNGALLGETGLAHFHRGIDEDADNCAEASWVISQSAQHKGIAKEAALAVHQWYVSTFLPSKTICLIAKDNTASRKVAEHIGYRISAECLYKGAECLKLECRW
ncbi:GNAT family N-acetyltransferase [Superficieibacter electus]|nr:GNAT family N-acetyltransferase [Superficieibacter electus]